MTEVAEVEIWAGQVLVCSDDGMACRRRTSGLIDDELSEKETRKTAPKKSLRCVACVHDLNLCAIGSRLCI